MMTRILPSFVLFFSVSLLHAKADSASILESPPSQTPEPHTQSGDPLPTNSALIPVSRLEPDSYHWEERHAKALAIKDTLDPEVILIGDSITHFWGGQPSSKANGPKSFEETFHGLRVLNLGFGWDRTQNVLWRIDHGELDGLRPRLVIVNIGTNNTSETRNARKNTAEEIAEGVRAVCARIRSKLPEARIVLMGIFPRESRPDASRRQLIAEVNQLISKLDGQGPIQFLDITEKFLSEDGTLPRSLMPDLCHPNEMGYQIWGRALEPILESIRPAASEK